VEALVAQEFSAKSVEDCADLTVIRKVAVSKAGTSSKTAILRILFPIAPYDVSEIKAFLSRFLDQTPIRVSQFFLTRARLCLPMSVEYELKYNTYASVNRKTIPWI